MGTTNANRRRRRESGIWQRRFWEHQIRDENDLQKHVDYTHYNPVKHGLVDNVADWQWSTYHSYVKAGWYREKGFDLSAFDDEKSFGE
jgi:putative transposase